MAVKRENAYTEIISGAIAGARNPYGDAAEKHAELYYEEIRKRKSDVAKIAATTGYSEKDIQKIKNFIFYEQHDLGRGEPERFESDYMMAESWRRLQEGKPEHHDITLLKHELMERGLMEKGYSQDIAHIEASKVYNYGREAEEYYGKIKKYRKE